MQRLEVAQSCANARPVARAAASESRAALSWTNRLNTRALESSREALIAVMSRAHLCEMRDSARSNSIGRTLHRMRHAPATLDDSMVSTRRLAVQKTIRID